MSPWFGALLLGVFITAVFGNSEKVTEYNVIDDLQIIEGSAEFDSTEWQQLWDRLETLESAVKSIVTALASQKNEIIAPITAILEQNAALRAILSSTQISQNVPENSTTYDDVNSTIITKSEAVHTEEEKRAVKQLRGAVKCSLAQLLDISISEKEINPSGSIKASLDTNKSIEIEWSPLFPECIDYNSGVWIRVFESGTSSSEETYLSIPRKCLKEEYNTTLSLVVHSPSSTKSDDEQFDKNDCHFELKNILIECRAYTIEVVPNYESLKGITLTTEIVIPSTNANSIDMDSLSSSSSNSLNLNWKDNSGCALQLTSFYLKTMIDGKVNAADVTNGSLKIPRTCLKQQKDETNVFSLALSADDTCPVDWTSLDSCRKYSFEMKSEYSNTWRSAPYVWETFTSRKGSSPKEILYGQSSCKNSEYFYCTNRISIQRNYFNGITTLYCTNKNQICDGKMDCDSEVDEHYCDHECSNGFKCGRQCIPKGKVCDGTYDCADGADEHYDCEYTRSCSELTDTKGSFSSQTLDSDDVFKQARKSIVAISVQINHTIWLSFNTFNTTTNHPMMIYDGPYLTSPLLLSHSGSTNPPSIRSSSNNLYVEFPAYYDKSYGISVFYKSMESTGKPFIPECGGYVNGDGVVTSPNYLSDDDDIAECYWFVEARKSDGIVFLKRNTNPITDVLITTMRPVLPNLSLELPVMTVFDSWNISGQVLYDELNTSYSVQAKDVVYSISEKMMVRFTRPKVSGSGRIHWSVSTIPTVQTTTDLVGMIGTIKSPNYPASYSNSSDYRWKIVTKPNTSIRLLFVLFETQEKFDFVSVYDGPTVNSRLLLEKSGLSTTPFTVNSSSNEMLVRFTSDEAISLSGFLAVYSTV